MSVISELREWVNPIMKPVSKSDVTQTLDGLPDVPELSFDMNTLSALMSESLFGIPYIWLVGLPLVLLLAQVLLFIFSRRYRRWMFFKLKIKLFIIGVVMVYLAIMMSSGG